MSKKRMKEKIIWLVYRLLYRKEIKELLKKIEYNLINGTSDIKPKGILPNE